MPSKKMEKSAAKLGSGTVVPTRSTSGKGGWGKGESKSAGGSQTVVSAAEMCKGDKAVAPVITNHKGEPLCCGKSCKMGKTQRAMMVGTSGGE
jgi:hypothetical protein